MVHYTKQKVLFNEINFKIKMQIGVFEMSRAIENNGLRAREGRETNTLNCKPNTNLNEKYELSNFSKTSGFILHAVSCCGSLFSQFFHLRFLSIRLLI
jgi:hypothetical protein